MEYNSIVNINFLTHKKNIKSLSHLCCYLNKENEIKKIKDRKKNTTTSKREK